MVKVAKSNQDMRFDVPIIGAETIRVATDAGLRVIAGKQAKPCFCNARQLPILPAPPLFRLSAGKTKPLAKVREA